MKKSKREMAFDRFKRAKKPWIEINRSIGGEFYWHARASNGKVLADSGETYKRKAALRRTLDLLFEGRIEIVDLAPRGGVP
jgi:uncharacterized protein YegP (UPF0339 family)